MTHDELVRFAAEKVRVSDDELAALIKCKGHMQTLEIDLAWDLQAARDAYLALREEVKEADRKAGEARRHWEYMRDRQHAHDDWLRKAKRQWGVHENTSFDVVWNECLQLKAENQALRARQLEIDKWFTLVATEPKRIQEMMEKNNLVIRDHDDPMQKLAFTLYTHIVRHAVEAEKFLDDGRQRDT